MKRFSAILSHIQSIDILAEDEECDQEDDNGTDDEKKASSSSD